ncbi:MAG: hypothetical protein ACK5OP_10075 [Sphingobacteriales bacterium]|jgi:hypothetical protein
MIRRIGKFSLSVPLEYDCVDENDEVVIFNEENGRGSITISSYVVPSEYHFDLKAELLDFINSIDPDVRVEKNLVSGDRIWTDFIFKGKYWLISVIFRNNVAVFASYNSVDLEGNDELDIIKKIIDSIVI